MYMRTLPLAEYDTEGDLLDEENLQGDSGGFDLGGLPPPKARWTVPTRTELFRKTYFQLWSHDQGGGDDYDSQGMHNGSYSWFDISVERLDSTSWLTGSIEWPSSLIFITVDMPDDVTHDVPADVPHLPDVLTFVQKDVKRPFLPSPSTLQKTLLRKAKQYTISSLGRTTTMLKKIRQKRLQQRERGGVGNHVTIALYVPYRLETILLRG